MSSENDVNMNLENKTKEELLEEKKESQETVIRKQRELQEIESWMADIQTDIHEADPDESTETLNLNLDSMQENYDILQRSMEEDTNRIMEIDALLAQSENSLLSSLKDAEDKLKRESIFLNEAKDQLLNEEPERQYTGASQENINRLERAEEELKDSSAEFNLILTQLNSRLEEKRLANEKQLELNREQANRSFEAIANKVSLLEELKRKTEEKEISENEAREAELKLQAEKEQNERLLKETEEREQALTRENERLLREQERDSLLREKGEKDDEFAVRSEAERAQEAEYERISTIMDTVIDARAKAINFSPEYKDRLDHQKNRLHDFTSEEQDKLVRDYFTILNMNDSNIKTEIVEKSTGRDDQNPNGILFIYPSLFLSMEELNFFSSFMMSRGKVRSYMRHLISLLLDENVFFVYTNPDGRKRIGYFYDSYIKVMIEGDYGKMRNDQETKGNINRMVKEEIMRAVPDNMGYNFDIEVLDSDVNRKQIHELLEMLIEMKSDSILASIKREIRLKRSIQRQPSFIVSKQTSGDCWNYSICRVIVRLICNVLDILDQSIPECNSLYEALDKFGANKAKYYCKPTPADSSDYIKLLLYVFFVYLGYTNYAVCENTHSGRQVKGKLDGQNPTIALEYFVNTILNSKTLGRDFFAYVNNMGFINVSTIHPELKSELTTVILPLLINFGDSTNHSCLVKRFPPVNAGKFINMSDMKQPDINSGIQTCNRILDKGLYLTISVYMGSGQYKKEFNNYRKNNDGLLPTRPYAEKIIIKLEEVKKDENEQKIIKQNQGKLGSHAMVIIKYDIVDGEDGLFVYTIRNSWGSNWGDNGTIQILSTELAALSARFNWIEPSDLSVLKQARPPNKVIPDPYVKIGE